MSDFDLFGYDDSFFTRDDEIDYIEEPLGEAIRNQFGIDVNLRCYIEDGNMLDVDVSTSDGYEYNLKLSRPIDMRRIRRPSDLSKYVPELLKNFTEQYDGNTWANFYYQLMNMLDDIALSGRFPTKREKEILDDLLVKSDSTIEDVADANDCYNTDDELCHTWDEMISALHILFEHGERG